MCGAICGVKVKLQGSTRFGPGQISPLIFDDNGSRQHIVPGLVILIDQGP
jgi:hypothetical protein